MSPADEMLARLDEGISDVYVEFPDLDGVSRSKLVDAEYFREHWEEGISMNMLLLAVSSMTDVPEGSGYGSEINYADGVVQPVPDTFARVPWQENTARVICEFSFRGEPAGAYTRGVLGRVLAGVADRDVRFRVGHELEFHLLADAETGYEPLTQHQHECVTHATGQAAGFYDRVKRWADALGVRVRSIQHEYGAGQFEVLFDPAPPLESADQAFTFRQVVKQAAAAEGYHATFMAKPFTEVSANGYHLHVSGWWDGSNALGSGDELSETGRLFVGGLLQHADGLAGLLCPTINAFKRYRPGGFSPYSESWGYNNRTAAVRVPESRPVRVENRIGSADANPYLVVAGTLAAGLHGIDAGLDPGAPVDGDAHDQRPALVQAQEVALDALKADEVLVDALGAEFVRVFTAVKRRELEVFREHVTDWEQRYLEVL